MEIRGKNAPVALTPLGAKAARVFFVGVLMDKKETNDAIVARVADSKGSVTVIAHATYQAQPFATLKTANTPCYVAVVGKVRQGKLSRPFVRPEYVTVVTEKERQLWEREAEERAKRLISEIETNEERKKLIAEKYGDEYLAVIRKILGEEEKEKEEEKAEEVEEEDAIDVDLDKDFDLDEILDDL